jgi:hypothetical protein
MSDPKAKNQIASDEAASLMMAWAVAATCCSLGSI